MKYRLVVAVAIMVHGLALLGLSAAHANVILSYTGNDFTVFNTPYTDTDMVTATITLAQPLGDNLSLSPVNPLAFNLNDGVQTITNATSGVSSLFLFSTNATGDITAWDAIAEVVANVTVVLTRDMPGLRADEGRLPGAAGGNVNDQGKWTETNVAVPEPPTVSVLGAGLLGLGLLWRRRRQKLHLAQ